jgi:hypothetical protein
MASLPEEERFEMGRVVSRSFEVIGRNAALFLLLAVLLQFGPSILLRAVIGTPNAITTLAATGAALASFLISLFLNFLLQASVNYVTLTDLDGQRPDFVRTLTSGLRFAVPLFLLMIVSVLGIYGSMLLLIVPGVIVATMWSVATPAMVNENLGVFASLGRSRKLTKGHRWAIFGLLVVVGLLILVPLLVTGLVSGALGNPAAAAAAPLGLSRLLIQAMSMIVGVLFAVIITSIYVELRTIKEGATPQSLAQIFA